jgi:hypothetical protein
MAAAAAAAAADVDDDDDDDDDGDDDDVSPSAAAAAADVSFACLPAPQDRNAAPLNQLDVLMEETYEQILDLATEVCRSC